MKTWFLNATGLAWNMKTVLTFLMFVIQIWVTVAPSTLYPCLNNCKYFFLNTTILFVIFHNLWLTSINGTELKVGQENLYEDPCQDWLDLINKKLTTPNFPEVFEPNTMCQWNLTTDKGYYISLDFDIIRVSDKDKWVWIFE